MLSLLHHCEVTDTVPDLHIVLPDFILHVQSILFSKFRACAPQKVWQKKSTRLLLATEVFQQNIPSRLPLLGQSSQHQVSSAEEIWPCLWALSHPVHCQLTLPLRENFPRTAKADAAHCRRHLHLSGNCSHLQSNPTKLYFNLLLFHLIFPQY